MTNILVVGGAGYIGSTVTAHLVKAGHAVTVFDDLSHGHRAAVPRRSNWSSGTSGTRPRLTASSGAASSKWSCISRDLSKRANR